ncbi:AAA family ATPase [Streptococcus suis]|uniref:Spaf_1101 family AAA-like ATPase n=1 Tax=Streptococcus suis TaxID=1307 RepID=UPI0015524D29|nr:AAA family ATPase [Streptococcus suis]NQK09496.1 AAA family ATPase [Streptococcus suis]NQL52852.1 AAA family ATPase [Streptococcus suis]WNF74993.1 AAA family ATPase [Streptococcus suis]HEM4093188.1 AAA family ATPase [Streptococcus suis]
MRGFNNKIKSVYRELTNTKEKFGSFHKTLIHLHTPVSYDYKLFSSWTSTKYRKSTEDELFDIFFKNKKIKVDKTKFFSSFDKVVFSSPKEYISFLLLAEAILKNEIEIVVVTDHNTTKGIKKLQTAVSIITRTYPTYNIHPHILHGVEISAADKLHIVCIYDHEKESWVNQWLCENIISEKDGSYQHSLTIMTDFNCEPNFLLDNDSHDIDSVGKNNMWIKGGKISFKMFQEALLDYTVSVSLFEPNFEQKSYIKGLYIQSRGGDRSFLTGDKLEKDRDFFLTFSPSMNCLIGGRGTGKSTLIDMLQFVLSQDCDKQSKLEFLCNHANAFVLYVLEDAEYIIEVSLPDVLQENKDNILQYYGQNRENRYGYPYNYNSDSIKEWTRSQYTRVYKVEGKFFKLVDKTRILEKMFDRRYSVNELVRTADGEKITEFISDLMLKNKNLPRPNYGLRTQTLESFEAKLQELDKYRRVRKDSILKIIDDFNQTQVGKLRICYEQIDRWEVPDFESTLFKSNSTLNFSFENYRISKRDVADILYLVYQELGIKGFVNVILKQNIPNRYFILLKNISEENFAKHENKWRNNSEINDSNIPYLKTSIYSLIANSSLLDELKRVLKEHVANERLFLEFNINSKETSQHLDILYKEVSVLSLGQKVVAMLDFLLAYSDYSKDFRPLIIDQPEDNLDNRYIYRHLVQQFRDVKAQRQIILATHNATIVTNSMTDQVVIMESDGAHAWIESQGYVSEKFIKNHIINQLEGGRDSFKHKMSIYETALSE